MTLSEFGLAAAILFAASVSESSQAQQGDMMAFIQDVCWSPDGNALYFSATRTKRDYSDYAAERAGIYKHDFAAKSTTKIVDSAMWVSVSPTGKEIAVGKLVEGNREIFITEADGKNARRITFDPKEDFAPSWSPDGKTLLFSSKRDGTVEIYSVNTDTTGLKRITTSGESRSYNPAWSPDGKQIVYYFEKGDHRDQVYVMNADGSEAHNITNDTLNNIFAGWTPDGKVIYGQGHPDGTTKVFTVGADGTGKSPLLGLESFFARISPDGSKIAVLDQKDRNIRILSALGEPLGVVTMPE
jgi:TolB protein